MTNAKSPSLYSLESKFQNEIIRFKGNIEETKNEITSKFDKIRLLLDKKQNKLLQELNKIQTDELSFLNTQMNELLKNSDKQKTKSIRDPSQFSRIVSLKPSTQLEYFSKFFKDDFPGIIIDNNQPIPPVLRADSISLGFVKLKWQVMQSERGMVPTKFIISYKLPSKSSSNSPMTMPNLGVEVLNDLTLFDDWKHTKIIENTNEYTIHNLKINGSYLFKIKGCYYNYWSEYSDEITVHIQDLRVIMLGLDNSGKTLMLYKLKSDEIMKTTPTIGFNVETIQYKEIDLTIWDVGGHKRIRQLWKHYYARTNAIIFVIDSTDKKRLSEVKNELIKVLNNSELKNIPLLIYSNKQDLSDSMSVNEINEKLELNKIIKLRKWFNQSCSVINGKGLFTGFHWLYSQLPLPFYISLEHLNNILNYWIYISYKFNKSYQWNNDLTNIVYLYLCEKS